MGLLYITFDDYYEVDDYNAFLTAAKNNRIQYEEYIKIKPPYKRFLRLESIKDIPKFVNFEYADNSDIKFLISTVKPVRPNEEYILRRRPGKDVSYWDYIMPEPLEEVHKKDYIMVFKAQDMTELNKISKKLGSSKIYKWGKADRKGYKIYICFNPYIKGLVSSSKVLMEFGEGADSGLKHDKSIPSQRGELEYLLNYFVLVVEKLENKTVQLEYHENGKKVPLKKASFI